MDVIVTAEEVGILFFIVFAFNLDHGVEKVVLNSAKVGHLGECLKRLVRFYMDGHSELSDRNAPHVEIVKINYVHVSFGVERPNVFFKLFDIEVWRHTFHNDMDALFEDGDSGEHDDDREQVSANGVTIPEVRPEVNNCGGNNNAH
jgi:hypothetical protein